MTRTFRPLLLAALVYVLFRVWIAATAFDAIAIPVYEVPNMGNQAWLIADGFRGVPWSYYYDNAGGQLLTGVLAAPFYALFGPSYAALKLVPFLLGLGLLGLIWRFLDRNVGRTAAIVGVFAFALAPPTLSKYSLLAKGNHFEGLFFLFLPVVLAFEARDRENRAPWLFFAGLTGGFAVVVYYGSLLTIALLGPTLVRLRGLRGLVRDLRWIAPGLLAGLSPLLYLQSITGGRAGSYADRFTSIDPRLDASGMWSEARSLVVDTLPGGACFEDLGPLTAAIGEWTLMGVLAASWIILVVVAIHGARRTDEQSARLGATAVLTATYMPLVLGVIAVGVLKIRYMPPPVEIGGVRYLVSYYFYGVLASAVAIGALARRGTPRARAGAWTLITGLATTVLFVLPIGSFAFERAADGLRYPGTFFRNYGSLLQRGAVRVPETGRLTLNAAQVTEVAAGFDPEIRRDILFSAGNSLAYGHLAPYRDPLTQKAVHPPLDLEALLDGYPADARPWLLRGVGAHLRVGLPIGAPTSRLQLTRLETALSDPEGRELIAEGLGMSLEYPLRRQYGAEIQRTERALLEVPDDLRLAVRRGQGIDLGVRLKIGIEGVEGRIRATLEGMKNPAEREALRGAIEAEAGRELSAR